MNIDRMRHIDKRVGIPLCFMVGLLVKIGNLFSKRKQKQPEVGKTLFIELSEMGSAILVDPAMRLLRDKTGSELYFVIFQHNAETLNILQTIVHEHRFLINCQNLRTLIIDVFRFMRWCRKNKITTVIDLELYSRFTALLSVLSGSKFRIGFDAHYDEGFYRGHLINYSVRYNPHVHISINFMALVYKAMGYFNTHYSTVLLKKDNIVLEKVEIEPSVCYQVKNILSNLFVEWENKKILLFNINASDMLPQRKWLLEYFIETARVILSKNESILLIAIGNNNEKNYVQNFVDQVKNSCCINVAGMFNIQELLALCQLSSCMLTNDSGPAHFASVTSLKTFVLFGPETPDLYLPLGNAEAFYAGLACSPCVSAANHRKTDCLVATCMKNITVEQVSRKILNFFDNLS